jgi:hypothetical protein
MAAQKERKLISLEEKLTILQDINKLEDLYFFCETIWIIIVKSESQKERKHISLEEKLTILQNINKLGGLYFFCETIWIIIVKSEYDSKKLPCH